MKKLVMTAVLLTAFAAANAQDKNYWVVETKGEHKDRSVVKIYDTNNNLITETNVARVIDINKRKERKKLNRMLKETNSAALWSKR